MTEFVEELSRLCGEGGYRVSQEALQKMNAYYDCLVETNLQYNLTTITAPKEAALKHFFDSIIPCRIIPNRARVVDVGSGPGFPIAPLKAVREDIEAVAIESAQKKCDFIRKAAQQSGIRINLLCMRAEEAGGGDLREGFDVCVSRAVAQLNVLMELCAPLVKKGGMFLAYKADYEEELKQAKHAMKALGLTLVETVGMPQEGMGHHVLAFLKTVQTAQKYPRRYAKIIKSPL